MAVYVGCRKPHAIDAMKSWLPILLLGLAVPAYAKPWVRSFVVTAYEPAFHYGGPQGTADAPGSDCPGGTVPDNDYAKLLQTGWRSEGAAADLAKPIPGIEPYRLLAPALHFRGPAPDVDTYINPSAAPDPGLQQVSGTVSEGFDLDGKAATGGFVAPDGTRGIDNGLYRALGCLMAFRGPPGQGALSRHANARMRDGLYTMLIRLSGTASPQQDNAVTVEVGYSPDALVRNAAGEVLRDYSYRLVKTAQYTKLRGKIRNGVLTTQPVAVLKAPAFAWSESNRSETRFLRGRISLAIAADGSATGLIGGYRDWRDLYAGMAFNVALEGPFLEIPYHMNLIAVYYALRRNADADPDTQGHNRAISTAYRLAALPAFAVDPAKSVSVAEPAPSQRIIQERAQFRQADANPRVRSSP